MYLIRVLSFIGNVRFNVRGEHVPGCLGRGREGGWLPTGVGKGAWWLPAGSIRASQGTFSSLSDGCIQNAICTLKADVFALHLTNMSWQIINTRKLCVYS